MRVSLRDQTATRGRAPELSSFREFALGWFRASMFTWGDPQPIAQGVRPLNLVSINTTLDYSYNPIIIPNPKA